MNRTRSKVFGVLGGLALFVSCTASPMHPELVQVVGVVQVDSEPAEGVVLTLLPQDKTADQSRGAISTGISGADGSFAISTYALGDGTLPGRYAVTCVWSEFDPVSRSQRGDKLNGRYDSEDKTTIHWDINDSKLLDVGTVVLQR